MPNFSGVWNLKEQIQAIAAGRWTGLPSTELYAWGTGATGRTGLGDTVNRSSPTQVSSDLWTTVRAGGAHGQGVKLNGTLWGWGSGSRIGQNSTVTQSSPVQIGSDTDWYYLSAGSSHTMSVKTNGTLWAWGLNNGSSQGKLGDGTIVTKSSPVQIGALTNWDTVSAGSFHTASIKTDGTLWTWGRNIHGALGFSPAGVGQYFSSPQQVGSLTTWAKVDAGGLHTAAVKTDGTLWTWGSNFQGQLGNNGSGYSFFRSSPVQIGSLTNWLQPSAAYDFTACVKTDGTIWTWGSNGDGQLGHGDAIAKSSPVQVGALTSWSKVSTGHNENNGEQTAALKITGTLWTWGRNGDGQLGTNNITYRSSPVQVGTKSYWTDVSVGNEFVLANGGLTN